MKKYDFEKGEWRVAVPGSGYSREQRRRMLREKLPRDIDILISAIAERSTDLSKDQLALIYLAEPLERRRMAAGKFQQILHELDSIEVEADDE